MSAIVPSAALFLTSLFIWLALKSGLAYRFLDEPNHRSLHTRPTPHIGGEAMVLAVAAVLIASLLPPKWLTSQILLSNQMKWPLIGALLLAITGSLDDRFKLPVLSRLLAQAAAAGLAIWSLSTSIPTSNPTSNYWTVGLLLFFIIIWATNLYNFMDGADGIAGTTALIGFSTFNIVAPQSQWGELSLILAASSLGFLCFNWSPAKTFLGDAGSTSLGYLAAVVGIAGAAQSLWPVWFVLLVFLSFLFDSGFTLLRRLINREKFWQGHRSHLYQRLVQTGWSHGRLCFWMAALQLACCLCAIVTNVYSPALGGYVLLFATTWHIGIAIWIHQKWVRHQANDPLAN